MKKKEIEDIVERKMKEMKKPTKVSWAANFKTIMINGVEFGHNTRSFNSSIVSPEQE